MTQPGEPVPQPFSIGDPKKNGVFSVLMGIVSFFIIPYLGIAAVVMGCFGVYFSLKQKSGALSVLLNLLGVIIGFSGFLASQLAR
ncbi:hypothetical protein A3A66_03745 [Microgenomates group bacterium RIFCSPLOWO2_01_FULL_46_13]|nr:MAG: hypothetical protein A2783_00435 [Microgenomates group bacterium RIFCSPHIGHO2_01_FULL_45_11]OGV95178.1 MAG: hypothetical protein A3A66_03745 [Microgenomates group bacterium RIFCSPLOWO2_01_FULL_46_13]